MKRIRYEHDDWQGGRGRGGRFFERGAFKFALLELLAAEPMHGYQLIKAMEEKTDGLYSPSPGSVYPNLQLLEDMRLIRSSEADGKKLYEITDEGSEALREWKESESHSAESLWEPLRRHRAHWGKHGKHRLRAFVHDWFDVVHRLAEAAEAAKRDPGSRQAAQFRELMAKLQAQLNAIEASSTESQAAKSSSDAER